MVYIYCLLLENNKYYIGKTNNPNYRLNDHLKGKGSAWTRLHKPVKLLELITNCDDYDEDKYVRIYMDKYGINNVRGGSFSKIKLSQNTKKQLEQMSRGTNDRCFKCGEKGHFSSGCRGGSKSLNKNNNISFEKNSKTLEPKQVVDVIGNIFNLAKDIYLISQDKSLTSAKKKKYLKGNVVCYRCGRYGHYANGCKNKTHKNGYKL